MSNKFKRVLSLVLSVAMVITGLQISAKTTEAEAAVLASGQTIYFDVNGLDFGNGVGAGVYFLSSSAENPDAGQMHAKAVRMEWIDDHPGVCKATVPAGIDAEWVCFGRFAGGSNGGYWNSKTVALQITQGNNCYKATSWNQHSAENNSGYWYKFGNADGATEGSGAGGSGDSGGSGSGGSDEPTTANLKRIYFECGWDNVYMYLYNSKTKVGSGENPTIPMSKESYIDGNHFYYDVDLDKYDSVIFAPSNGSWNGQYPAQSDGLIDISGENNFYKINGFKGKHEIYYMVDTDLVDYFNDARIEAGGEYTNGSTPNTDKNQGTNEDHRNANPTFGYLNEVISGNKFKYPLYFGDLLFLANRRGKKNNGELTNLQGWNSAVNVAFGTANATSQNDTNPDAVVQGLVSDTLGTGGKLMGLKQDGSVVSEVELPYFSKYAADNWKASGKNVNVMRYYDDLLFPFKTTVLENGTKKYSYDSEKGHYPVYYDYGREQIVVGSGATYNKTNTTETGYFPFNSSSGGDPNRNYGFGTKFTIPFTINKNGTIDGTETGDPITFKFTGDDDVWVFLDGKLILDMGGSHGKATGEIDFKKLTATVEKGIKVSDAPAFPSNWNSFAPGSYTAIDSAVREHSGSWTAGDATMERFKDSGSGRIEKTFSTLTGSQDFENSFKDPVQTHVLTMFYMERGMHDSNMSIEFTIVPLPSGVTVGAQVDPKYINPGLQEVVKGVDTFSYNITGTTSAANASIKNANGDVTGTTISGNVLTGIKHGFVAYDFKNASNGDAYTEGNTLAFADQTSGTALTYNNETTVKLIKPDSTTTTTPGTSVDLGTLGTGDYSVLYTYYPVGAPLQITKAWNDVNGASDDTTTYKFKVEVDVDGLDHYDYWPATYALTGKCGDQDISTDENGILNIKAGQTVVLNEIPVGAYVRVSELQEGVIDWQVSGTGIEGIQIAENSNNAITITNMKKPEQVVYMEAATDVVPDGTTTGINGYTVKEGTGDSAADIVITEITAINGIAVDATDESGKTVTTANSDGGSTTTLMSNGTSELTVTVKKGDEAENPTGTISISSPIAGEKYVIYYNGTKGTGDEKENVSGKLKVYTYKATKKVYVLDYGLPCDITATESGNGLLQDGVFFNTHATGTTASLNSTFTKASEADAQVSISMSPTPTTTQGKVEIDKDTSKLKDDFKVVATPQAFMSQVDVFDYSAEIAAVAGIFDEEDPTTGTTVHGQVKVMPASIVYYEDNFSSAIQIISKNNNETEKNNVAITQTQSNNQSELYGHDKAYESGKGDSAGGSTSLKNLDKAVFEFQGTGFELLCRSSRTTGNLSVIIYKAGEGQAVLNKVTGAISNAGGNIHSIMAVSTYYENGVGDNQLYQVPVIHKDGLPYGKYIVQVIAIASNTYTAADTVYLDGVRIFNPLDKKSDTAYYIDNEEGAKIINIREALFGSGFKFDYNDPTNSITPDDDAPEEAKPKVSLFSVTNDGTYLSGKTVVEAYRPCVDEKLTGEDKNNLKTPDVTSDMMSYAVQGPNNELYLDPTYGLGFQVREEGTVSARTLQIGMKVVGAAPVVLERKINGTWTTWKLLEKREGELTQYLTLDSATEMYYDLTDAISGGSGGTVGTCEIRVASGRVSITGLKVKGYKLQPMTATSQPVTKNDALELTDFMYKSGYSNEIGFFEGRDAIFTCKTTKDVVDVKLFDSNNQEVAITSRSYKDAGETRLWTIRFRSQSHSYKMQAYDENGNYSEAVTVGK